MYLSIIFLPLFSFIIVLLFGRFLGHWGSAELTLRTMGFCFLLSLGILYEVSYCNSVIIVELAPWFGDIINIYWTFYFDQITSIMLFVVTLVSLLVHLYSIEYMSEDPHLSRFMGYLSLFTFFMLFLVTAGNYVQLFLGWEGVGLASYLLINFWFTRLQANKSALKAMIVNRVGDFSFIFALVLIYEVFGSLNFEEIFFKMHVSTTSDLGLLILKNSYFQELDLIFLINLFLLFAAVGKSAQIFLHTWLPDAMEGPTPVSALIHAATMVTAGVFLLLRSVPLIDYYPEILLVITIFGVITTIFAATSGCFQQDIKKIIAYSTCSQLGYMIFTIGLSNYSICMFHLMNHAFFKALLFLSAGSVIHALSDEQDIRKMGGLSKLLPLSYVMILIGSLALMGFPFLSGFYSKDIILELSFIVFKIDSLFVYWIGTFSAFLTSFYSIRLLFLVFFGNANGFRKSYENIHDASLFMSISLLVLGIFSIFSGYFFKDLFMGLGTNFWYTSVNLIYSSTENKEICLNFINFKNYIDLELIPVNIKNLPFFFSVLGFFCAFFLNNFFFQKNNVFFSLKLNNFFRSFYLILYKFFSFKWYFDTLINSLIVRPFLNLAIYKSFYTMDRGFIEVIGPLSLVRLLDFNSKVISSFFRGLFSINIIIMLFNVLIGLFLLFIF